MTREEAIKRLIDERDNDIFASDFRDKQHEALTLAIKSLEAWDKVLKTIHTNRELTKFCSEFSEGKIFGLDIAEEIINKYLGEVEE